MNITQAVAAHSARGATIETLTDDLAVVVYGNRPNHILHLLLTIVTAGLWFPVWAVLDVRMRPKHVIITREGDGVREDTHKQAVSLYQKHRARKAAQA